MSTPEDRLAALLREEAETVVPAGDGLARIRDRVAARRRRRWLWLPAAAAVTGGAVAAAFLLGGNGGRTTLVQTPATPGPSPTASAAPTVAGGGLDHAFENPAVWPFHSAQEIAQWRSTYPYADDKTALVQHYLQDVLAISGYTLAKPCESCDVVDIRVAGRKVGTAALERFLVDGAQVWTISTIGGTDLRITRPTLGEAVSSPTTVTGRITGVDEHVNLALVSQAGGTVATGGTQAGSAAPWSASLSWTDASWSYGAVVAETRSAKDGSLDRLTAVPVARDAATPAPAPAIWPFASAAQVSAWRADPSGKPWATDARAVAAHFLSDYLRLPGLTVGPGCASCLEIDVRTASTSAGTLHLVADSHASPVVYSVTGVDPPPGLSVTRPVSGQRVGTPVQVGGGITGVDESILVRLLSQAGKALGQTSAPAGSGRPWTASLPWSDRSWYTGALVLTTTSPKDGSVNRLAVLRVVRAP